MRIALVSPYDLGKLGGVQSQVLHLAEWLRDDGHTTVVLGPGKGPPNTISLGPATVINVNGAAAPIRLDPRVGTQLQDYAGDSDVVHVHEPLMPMVGAASARIRGPALVGTFHADPSPAARWAYRLGGPAARTLLRRYDVMTAVSPVAAGALPSQVTTTIVPNGIDVGAYSPSAGDPMRVVFLGRDDPRKGLDVLLAAWPAVRAQIPDACLDVVGARRDDSSAGVHFHGPVSEGVKRTQLAQAAIFCAPNLGGESFGIILAEAMASRCAIVASALPSFTHVVGDAGILVKPGDPDGLGRAIVRLLRDTGRTATLQRAGAERVQRYDRRSVVDGYLDVYARAIMRRRVA